jgi:uncharacterized protein
MMAVQHMRGVTFHGRKGALRNSFRYSVDYLLADPDTATGPSLFSVNRGNVTALHDLDHGGTPRQGRGTSWVREVLAQHHLPPAATVRLLAQPRVFGHVFNPVSFWLCHDAQGALHVVIAEVSNTYGDRHSYLCHRDDHGIIRPEDTLAARKIFHVSPFQPVAGDYAFRFDIRPDRIGIWIDYTTSSGGLFTNLIGPLRPLTNRAILWMCLRRPFGSRRVLALIHWQAAKLALKGAPFRSRPTPPSEDVTR